MRNSISELIKEISSDAFQSHTFEPITGDVVVNDNPGCKHRGSMGVVQSVQELPDDEGKTATYKCVNSGDNWKKGDTLTKTLDQLVPAVSQDFAYHIKNDIPISESPLDRKSRAFLALIQECRTLMYRGAYKPSLDDAGYIFCMSSSRYNNDSKRMTENILMKITRKQLRSVIREALSTEVPELEGGKKSSFQVAKEKEQALKKKAKFPDLKHPTIAQFADKTYGPQEGDSRSWYVASQSYRYNAGGSSDQNITVYLLPDGKYSARVFGNYSNTLSKDLKGRHDDAESAIEAALDSSPSNSGPSARELLIPVGEKVKRGGYYKQD